MPDEQPVLFSIQLSPYLYQKLESAAEEAGLTTADMASLLLAKAFYRRTINEMDRH